MALTKEFKQKISELPQQELAKLVIKIAVKDSVFSEYIKLTYFKDEIDENEVFEDYKSKIHGLILKRYKGYANEEKAAHFITASNKELMNFEKVSKNKELLVELILVVLDCAQNDFGARFGTCFTAYEYKFSLLLKKAIKIINNQMHEDMILEYKGIINSYLSQIKTSKFLDYISALPSEI
uniref:hypothetical protein n=1 Tax=Flavobacterium sp. TaxID=239 RepID=UPI00404B390A